MAPGEASWAIFMGQVGHGFRLAMAQLATSKKKIQKEKKNGCHFLPNYSEATKTFCFCGKLAGKCLYKISQLIWTH